MYLITTMSIKNAHQAVDRAIKKGLLPKITKDTKCVDCGKRAVAYDHRDYARPLDVEPVCQSCNTKRGPAKDKTKYRNKEAEKLVRASGGARKVAGDFGISTQAVYQWIYGTRPIPSDKLEILQRSRLTA